MKLLSLTLAFLLAAAPAMAAQCPADMAAIDAALAAGTSLSDAEVAEVKALRDEGESLHESGDHAASVEILARAKGMLGLE
ncbi:hypothetical protein [Roseovarius aestuarii]|uniref:Uncharacterized protein n=1 Tax=Roseovarius aestuarii TaxID=475083 RepID=A0A1X7BXG3_9RHOB|nr:hypothetical protein [Roseovarius aestuarii]SMC14288.1 hypothetical protein ROA7745_04154 [Roseovarius aestuarii]